VSTLGTILPPLITLSIISFFYTKFRDNAVINALMKGMQAGVVAVIADAVIDLGNNIIKEKQAISVFIMIGAFIATYFFNINLMYIIIACGLAGVVSTYLRKKSDRSANKE
ncbi:MAG: chromate transporter, partial [Clostridiaceae bacterium]|nr:chromate transporter [Clostridiaceae bacterium]